MCNAHIPTSPICLLIKSTNHESLNASDSLSKLTIFCSWNGLPVYLQEPSSEDARVKTISDLRVGDWIKVQGSMQVESFINEKSEAALFLSLRIQEPWTYLTDPDDGDGNKLDSGVSTSTNANAVKDPSNVSSDDDMSSDDGTKKLKQAKSNQQARTGDKRLSDDRCGSDSNDADDEAEVDKRVRMTRSIAARVYRKRPRLTHPTDPALSVIVRLDSGNTLSDPNNDADNNNDSDSDSDNNEDNAPHEQEAGQGKAAESDDRSSQDDDSSSQDDDSSSQDDDSSSHGDDDSNDTDDTDDHERDAEDDSQGSTDDQEGDSEDDSQDSTDDQENGSGEETQSEADDQDGDSSDTSDTSQDETNDQESDSENDSSSDLDASQDEANDQGCTGGDALDDRKDNLNADSKSDSESDETESSGSDETESSGSDETESDTNSSDHDDSNTETNDSDTCDSSNSNSDSQEEAVKVSRNIIEISIDGRDMDRSPPPYSLRPRSDELPLPRVGSIPEDELLVPNLVAVGMAGSTVSELVRFDDDRHGQEPQRTYHHFNGRGQGTHDGESVNENRMAYLFSQRFSDNSRREVHVLIRPAEDESVDTLTVWEKVFASDGDEAWTKLLTNE